MSKSDVSGHTDVTGASLAYSTASESGRRQSLQPIADMNVDSTANTTTSAEAAAANLAFHAATQVSVGSAGTVVTSATPTSGRASVYSIDSSPAGARSCTAGADVIMDASRPAALPPTPGRSRPPTRKTGGSRSNTPSSSGRKFDKDANMQRRADRLDRDIHTRLKRAEEDRKIWRTS